VIGGRGLQSANVLAASRPLEGDALAMQPTHTVDRHSPFLPHRGRVLF